MQVLSCFRRFGLSFFVSLFLSTRSGSAPRESTDVGLAWQAGKTCAKQAVSLVTELQRPRTFPMHTNQPKLGGWVWARVRIGVKLGLTLGFGLG